MLRRLHSIAVFALGSLAVLCYGAQSPTGTAPTQDTTVLHANANLVLLDVVVTEHDKAVHGLNKQRFHVLEDGHEQAITSFEEHKPASIPSPGAKPPALPPHVFSNIPQYPEASAINVLLLDGLNTPMADQTNARLQMLQFMGTIEPGTPLAIFTLSSRLRLVEGFTTDVSVLTKALKSPMADAQRSVLPDTKGNDADQANQEMDNVIGDMDKSGNYLVEVAAMQQFEADLAAYQTDQRVLMTLGAMQQLARYLGTMPGRKNLIWFSGSFPLELVPDDSLQSPFNAMRNYSRQIKETSEMLSAARVAVYPVDARGLIGMPTFDASYTQSGRLTGQHRQTSSVSDTTAGVGNLGASHTMSETTPPAAKDNAQYMQLTIQTHASMLQIAHETGGKEYFNTNGLKEAVASAIDNGSSYYTISFVPTVKELNGQFRKINVKVDDGDYKLAYRNGYFADPPEKLTAHSPAQINMFMTATMHGALPSTQIPFKAHVMETTDPSLRDAKLPAGPAGDLAESLKGPVHRFIVDLNVDPRGLTYDDTPDGSHEAQIELLLVAYDDAGNRINYLDNTFRVKFDAKQLAQATTSGISARIPLDVPAGRHFLRVAVHDLVSGSVGSLEVPMTVAAK
jgi:VWFA-related protein